MRAMMDSHEKPAREAATGVSGRGLQRLQFELALHLSVVGRPVAEALARAAETAGADLVFVLPAPNGEGMMGVVRLNDEGSDFFLQVGTEKAGFPVSEEAEMDKTLLGLARASVDVLQRMSADRNIRGPLADAL